MTANSQCQSRRSFVHDNKNIGRRLADVNGDGFADIVVAYGNNSIRQVFTYVKNSTTAYLLKGITNEYGGIIEIDYMQSTLFNNTQNNSYTLNFNLWVVQNVTQNNSLIGDFSAIGNYSYVYSGGKFDYNLSEFAGFGLVNETTPANTKISHYFHQSEALRGKEFKTEVYNSSGSLFSKQENYFNFTLNDVYRIFLVGSANYLYDGNAVPKVTNITYSYDGFGNVIRANNLGDIDKTGDEKYEEFVYVHNTDNHILDKVLEYSLFDSANELVKRNRYSYDGLIFGGRPTKADITKIQEWHNKGEDPVTQFEYDNFGNLIKQINPLNQETKYEYGLRDGTFTFVDRVVNALGHRTDFEYDLGTGNLLWQEQNEIRTNFVYDKHGRIIKEIRRYDSENLPTKEYKYSIDGTAPEIINISQRETADNYVTSSFFYDGFAQLVQLKLLIEDGNAITKNFFYDSAWRVKAEQNPYIETFAGTISTPSNTTNKIFYSYDALDNVIKVTNPDGTSKNTNFDRWTLSDYDENGNKHDYYLDAYGRITNVIEFNV
ncbi:MAG: toxin TcdB middle/N-terminal domain-containing protein, partial [Nanoarchaeota archaeon]